MFDAAAPLDEVSAPCLATSATTNAVAARPITATARTPRAGDFLPRVIGVVSLAFGISEPCHVSA